ncbi:hypothetical protein [Ancylobacter oerskovii]|uniref:Uncharacterized protein n=1 Tax=Ancylobacter oerskovii TaxID=459519 RepID=A0ABW4Z5S0_9HYPH|nr:hypothetical protein [Ancylobacter oerskovii]MBS7545525.1 hypothetical protein [Ancylobacter oerskovii]
MTMQETPRASATTWPQATTAAKLADALGGLKQQLGAANSLVVDDVPRATARARLRRAHVRVAQLEFETRAIYAIALGQRKNIQDLSATDVIEAGEAAGLFLVSDAPAPKLERLVEPFETVCPRCNGLLRTMTAGGCKMAVMDSSYGDDGDGVPGTPLEFVGCASVVMATVGTCRYCEAAYWALDVFLHTAGTQQAVEDILAEDPNWEAVFTAGQKWTAHVVTTDSGRGYEHFIGPMLVPEGMETHGSNGVSACGGGAFWQHALAVFESYRPRIEAVQRELVQAVSGAEGVPA